MQPVGKPPLRRFLPAPPIGGGAAAVAGMETGTLICETRSMPPSVIGPAATDEGGAAAGDPAVAAGPRRIELTGTVGSCGCDICNNSHDILDMVCVRDASQGCEDSNPNQELVLT